MKEIKEGKLCSQSGNKVLNPKQATSIGLSDARNYSIKFPQKSNTAPAKLARKPALKCAPKKPAAKN